MPAHYVAGLLAHDYGRLVFGQPGPDRFTPQGAPPHLHGIDEELELRTASSYRPSARARKVRSERLAERQRYRRADDCQQHEEHPNPPAQEVSQPDG